MAARPGMTSIIQELRSLTDASEDDTTVNNVSYWSDEQIQGILDLHRRDALDVALVSHPLMEDGERVTKRYYIPDRVGVWIDNDPSVFTVVDAIGVVASGYSADLTGRQINFDSSTGDTAYYLRCRTFDMNAAASEVWSKKASHRASLIAWKAGGQTLAEDQEYLHCIERAKHFNQQRGFATVRMTRTGYSGT